MKGKVHYEKKGEIALLSIDNPPVNPLSSGVRQGLYDGLQKAKADDVKAIIITGMHSGFIAGADISEFGSNIESAPLSNVLEEIEQSPKPVIAAINGAALGGGLETALCCDYRIALNNAPVGLPEVKLGIIPGAGGTQRLTRLAGAKVALDLILSGRPVSGKEALSSGIVDQLVDDQIIEASIQFAQKIIREGAKKRKVRDMTDKILADRKQLEIFDVAQKSLSTLYRNQVAPEKIIHAIKAAVTNDDFDQGMTVERDVFYECFTNPQ
ncbi:MAG: enoyl-CoA hydratase/isomerase family protein, partial [Coxiellaceae bacterium]|nr:enoyl-CoA hydratase/isomerase family protein [Coxiellaceae bacterium]